MTISQHCFAFFIVCFMALFFMNPLHMLRLMLDGRLRSEPSDTRPFALFWAIERTKDFFFQSRLSS